MRVLVCGVKVPFDQGGAETLVETLCGELGRRGFTVDSLALPFEWSDRVALLRSSLLWRLVDLERTAAPRPDLVVATRFPSYLVRHPNKVVWLVHQHRQAYDLLGTRYSDFGDDARDRRVLATIRAIDRRTLGEARAIYTISRNTAERLARHNDLAAETLYPPPKLDGRHRAGEFGDYVLAVGRLDPIKRFDLLLRALAHVATPVRARLVGVGPEREALAGLAQRLGVAERVELMGWRGDDELLDLYAGALAVFYAPFDEDYGYVTVEAFKSGKPVITAADAGGVLEFVEDGRSGFVCPPDAPREIAARLDLLYRDRERARALGAAGRERVRAIGWDRVIEALTGAPEAAACVSPG